LVQTLDEWQPPIKGWGQFIKNGDYSQEYQCMNGKSKNKTKRDKLRKHALRKSLKRKETAQHSKDLTVRKDYFRLKGKKAESIIHELAEKTFLTDWCCPNPVLPNGKELCDLLVVFDDTAIIWQLKDTKLDSNGNFKESDVQKNQRQLLGACRQLFELKTNITLTNPRRGPETFIPSEIKCIHLISAFFGDNPSMITSREKAKGYLIHTFTKRFTEVILNELDTIADFQRYLQDREQLSDTGTSLLVLGGEEEVLAYYLKNNRSFDKFKNRDAVLLEDGIWEDLKKYPKYQAKKQANQVSYLWDSIIDRAHEGDSPQYELIARELARHDRFGRRILSKAFLGAHMIAHENENTFRRFMFMEDQDVVYCFLFQDDPEPRENRKGHLTAMCHVARSKHKEKKIIGIATEVKIRPTCSYDFALFKVHEWTEKDQKVLEELQAKTDILKSPNKLFVHEDEYPE